MDAVDQVALLAHRDELQARHDRALDCLKALLRQLERIQGYSTHDEQQQLRDARALLAEAE
jgi:hypothetical protein